MIRPALACAAIVALAGQAGAHAQEGLRTVTLADGVFAVLQPFDNRFNDSNAIVIVGPSSAIVIDSQTDPDAARRVIAEIRRRTDTPVRYVIATHWHGDHFQGNQAYRDAYPGVEFVAHEAAAVDMRTRAVQMRDDDVAQLRPTRPAVAERLAAIEFVFPTVTMADRVSWHLGAREVRLLSFRGHTGGDLVIYLPGDRILVTGDLMDDMPFLGHGFPAAYLQTLEALAALEWDVLVPGHGEVRRGRAHFDAVSAAFTAVYAEVGQAVRAGLSLEGTKARVNLAAHRARLTYGDARAGRAFDSFMASAIERMHEELSAR